MCVSAEASFSLTGVLVPVGLYCVKQAIERDRLAIPVAAIPLLFGIQQFCEGLVWVGIGRGELELARSAALAYLFFALAFWLPFCALLLETRRNIRLTLAILALLGLLGGAILFVPVVLTPDALRPSVVQHSIHYDYADSPALNLAPQVVWHMFYVAVVALPMILLKDRRLMGFSTLLVVSAVTSHIYFFYAFASIWCFFAALLSLYLGHLFRHWPPRLLTPVT